MAPEVWFCLRWPFPTHRHVKCTVSPWEVREAESTALAQHHGDTSGSPGALGSRGL